MTRPRFHRGIDAPHGGTGPHDRFAFILMNFIQKHFRIERRVLSALLGSSVRSQLASVKIDTNVEDRVVHSGAQFWQLLGFSGIAMPVFALVHSRTNKKPPQKPAEVAICHLPAEIKQ